jgi:hypothetical protein
MMGVAGTLSNYLFTVLIKAPFLILLSAVSLLQLQSILVFIHAAAANKAIKNQIGDYFRPALRELSPLLTNVFGKADTIDFSLTHILLVALLLSVLIHQSGGEGERFNWRNTRPEARREKTD